VAVLSLLVWVSPGQQNPRSLTGSGEADAHVLLSS
jgi:hypothetical protein